MVLMICRLRSLLRPSVSKTSVSKAPATSSQGALDSDLVGQMTVNPIILEVVDAQVSPPRDIISTDSTVEAAHATPAIFGVKPDLASELASSGKFKSIFSFINI